MFLFVLSAVWDCVQAVLSVKISSLPTLRFRRKNKNVQINEFNLRRSCIHDKYFGFVKTYLGIYLYVMPWMNFFRDTSVVTIFRS